MLAAPETLDVALQLQGCNFNSTQHPTPRTTCILPFPISCSLEPYHMMPVLRAVQQGRWEKSTSRVYKFLKGDDGFYEDLTREMLTCFIRWPYPGDHSTDSTEKVGISPYVEEHVEEPTPDMWVAFRAHTKGDKDKRGSWWDEKMTDPTPQPEPEPLSGTKGGHLNRRFRMPTKSTKFKLADLVSRRRQALIRFSFISNSTSSTMYI